MGIHMAYDFELTAPEAKDMKGHLKTSESALAFIFAGHAFFTLRSAVTQTRYTFQVKQAKKNERIYFVSLLTGSQNESDYTYFGFFKDREFIYGAAKARIGRNAPAVIAFEYAMAKLKQNAQLVNLEVWHDGRCGRCGRKLTVPESVERGIGPECALILGQQ